MYILSVFCQNSKLVEISNYWSWRVIRSDMIEDFDELAVLTRHWPGPCKMALERICDKWHQRHDVIRGEAAKHFRACTVEPSGMCVLSSGRLHCTCSETWRSTPSSHIMPPTPRVMCAFQRHIRRTRTAFSLPPWLHSGPWKTLGGRCYYMSWFISYWWPLPLLLLNVLLWSAFRGASSFLFPCVL